MEEAVVGGYKVIPVGADGADGLDGSDVLGDGSPPQFCCIGISLESVIPEFLILLTTSQLTTDGHLDSRMLTVW